MTNPPSSRRKLANGLTIEEYDVATAFLMHPTMANKDLWRKAVPRSTANDQTASDNVQEIMERLHVKAWLDAEQRKRFDADAADIDAVHKRQIQIATATFTDCLDGEGILMPPSKWPERARGAVKSLTVNRRPDGGETLRLEMHNPTASAELVYRRLGLLVDRTENKNLNLTQVTFRIEKAGGS